MAGRTAATGAIELIYEGKYSFRSGHASELLRFLRARLIPDPRFPEGTVSSVYFDTPRRDSLREKVGSDYRKEKLRLRWYGDPGPDDPVTGFLEVKAKEGVRRRKTRMDYPLSGAWLQDGRERFDEFSKFAPRAAEVGSARSGPVFPMIVIRYRRARFLDPDATARISLDFDLRVTGVNRTFFPPRPILRLGRGVLEVKSESGRLPRAMWPVRSRVARRDAFSKYEAAWDAYHDPLHTGGHAWTSFGS